jgi:hypothetical protein
MPRPLPEPFLVVNQTAIEEPTAWSEQLADAIEAAFAVEAWDLAALVESVNAAGAWDRSGQPWTVESLRAELERLGA